MRPLVCLGKGDLIGICHLYPAGIVFFQLHGGMVSLTQALATPSSTVHTSIKYLDSYHESISVLAASS